MKHQTGKQVCVVGLGYVGLPTAAVLASRGYKVHGVDVNPDAVETINSGRAHIVEPDLDMLVRAGVETGQLRVYLEPAESDVFLLCVPTPLVDGHAPDLSFVRAATESICPYLRPGNLVVLESTSPPGTTEMIAEIIGEKANVAVDDLHIAHAPERVLPGRVLREVVENDRVVGGLSELSTRACAAFYDTFVTGRLHPTSARMAETSKLVENAFRDVNISFANELSLMADELRIDVWELIELANHHPRVNILQPGAGVGGHCIAVDPWFLVHAAPGATRLIRQAREVNDEKPQWLVSRIKERASRFKNPRIACLGLAYKPNIDDLRESPALAIVRALANEDELQLLVVEPNLRSHPEFELLSVEAAIENADIVVVLVAHDEFREVNSLALAEKIIFDPCGALRAGR